MDKRLQTKLIHKYPQIFQDMYGDPKRTAMAWGIECGDGWYEIIDTCCAEIMATEPAFPVIAFQIKEKYGGLRFYINTGSEEVYEAIDRAEDASYSTCELCGKPGKQRGGGWIVTRCGECYGGE